MVTVKTWLLSSNAHTQGEREVSSLWCIPINDNTCICIADDRFDKLTPNIQTSRVLFSAL